MRCTSLAVAAVVLSCWSLAAEEAKPEARERVETAITEGIRLLEAKQYEAFVKAFVPPDDLKKVTEKKPLNEFVDKFAEKKAPHLLDILKSIKDTTPTLSADGTSATFALKKDLATVKEDITFKKIDKYWYIQN